MKITKEHALKAVLHGSCFVPGVGTDISEFSTENLIWAEHHEIIAKQELTELPLWLRSNGDGNGYGDGDGDGYGYGDGDGYQEAFKELGII